GEAVRREPERPERAVVAPEHGNAADAVIARVAREPDALERRAHRPEKGRLALRVPDHQAVADAAQLEAQHAGELAHVDIAYIIPRAEVAALLGRGEDTPHAELRPGSLP